MQKQLTTELVLRSLSEGIDSDRKNLPEFYKEVFSEAGESDAEILDIWTEDLISDNHPTTTLDDIWVVVDQSKDDKIVSALLLIPQTWRYAEVEFGFGRVELVATHKDYRRRGLVRELMNVAHQRSQELGHLMQGITGIPHYYRRFGYAFAVELGAGLALPVYAIPKLKEDAEPQFTLRLATDDDIPNLIGWSDYYSKQCLLSTVRDDQVWRYDFNGRNPRSPFYHHILIISDNEVKDVGYLIVGLSELNPHCYVASYIVSEQSSYLATYEDVLRGIKTYADDFYQSKNMDPSPRIHFDVGVSETIDTLIDSTFPGRRASWPYAWYIRIDDIPQFIRTIAPVLESRLKESGANRFTGELKISFYDLTGLTITFEEGKISAVETGEMAEETADAAFAYDYFLNVLLGHRSTPEITHIIREVYANRKARVLLETIFPRQRSWLVPQA